MKHRRGVLIVLIALVLVSLGTLPHVLSANGTAERISNGNFEEGFAPDGVGLGWKRFDNGGAASYGWYDETWNRAIFEGKHAQLVEINSFNWFPTAPDRYAGIYQTVSVQAGQSYQFSLRAMMRSTEASAGLSGYGYRVQYGVDQTGGSNWQSVTNWIDIGLNDEWQRTNPGGYFAYNTGLVATGSRLTIFIRGWKKWAQPNREFDLDIDAVSLRGATPADTELPLVSFTVPPFPAVGKTVTIKVHASNDVGITDMTLTDNGNVICSATHLVGAVTLDRDCTWTPATGGAHTLKATIHDMGGKEASFSNALAVGASVEFLTNGNFEGGFQGNGVGNSWTGFTNGGRAAFGFYDETWQAAVFNGAHGQLLEINTLNHYVNDPDRYVGIYQRVTGLTPGAQYQLTIRGMMRTTEANNKLSGYGYRIQYGVDYSGGANWQSVSEWTDTGINPEYPRLSPGTYGTYTTWLTANSDTLTLFVRGWKKWANPFREFDLDLDGLSLKGYQ